MPTLKPVVRPWMKAGKAKATPNQGRENPNRDVYGSQRWRKLSERKRQQSPLCEECKENGRLTPAQVVDHIKPINLGGEPFDEDNLRSLCKSCHERKSAKERHQKK